MSTEERPEEAKVQEKKNSNEGKMEPAPEDQKEQNGRRGSEDGWREETHSPHGRQETTEASAAAAAAGVELWPRAGVPRGVSPQLTDSDNTSSHSPRSASRSSTLKDTDHVGEQKGEDERGKPEETREERAWGLFSLGLADDMRLQSLRQTCNLVLPPIDSASTYTYLKNTSAFSPLRDVAQIADAEHETEYWGVLHQPKGASSEAMVVWIVGDRVQYHTKGHFASGILFGISRNEKSSHTSAWVSGSDGVPYHKLTLDALVKREAVASPEELRHAAHTAHPPVSTAPPPASAMKRQAAVHAEEQLIKKPYELLSFYLSHTPHSTKMRRSKPRRKSTPKQRTERHTRTSTNTGASSSPSQPLIRMPAPAPKPEPHAPAPAAASPKPAVLQVDTITLL